jgi:uncharacterized protein YhbP (UPF0306 family)
MSCQIKYRGQEYKTADNFAEALQIEKLEQGKVSPPLFQTVKEQSKFISDTFGIEYKGSHWQATTEQLKALRYWARSFSLPMNIYSQKIENLTQEHRVDIINTSNSGNLHKKVNILTDFESYQKKAINLFEIRF